MKTSVLLECLISHAELELYDSAREPGKVLEQGESKVTVGALQGST